MSLEKVMNSMSWSFATRANTVRIQAARRRDAESASIAAEAGS
jgi:hypothetical protein